MHKLSRRQSEKILQAMKNWSCGNRHIRGMAVVGSWDDEDRAHAEAHLDMVFVVEEPDRFRSCELWMREIDWNAAALGEGRWSDCDAGCGCARHLSFDDGTRVEVSFVPRSWAEVDPIDAATRRIAGNGMRVVHDPDGLLGRLITVL
ncbi:MAG: hypothetical protein ACK5JT_18630 [Hyphomicrobiaceae bacterium]